MTVKELIEELKKFDENLRVYVTDSEYPAEELVAHFRIQKDERIWDGPNHHLEDVLIIG